MSTVELNPRPIRVSPVIKFFRWTFLGLGVMYGMFYHSRFSKIEDARREKEERERPEREARIAAEKKRASELEMKNLEAMMAPAPK